MYNMYRELCFYTLKVLFPGFGNEKLIELFNTLYDKAYDPLCYVESGEPSPKILYYTDNIGLYPYYKAGAAHICIIPITKQYLDKLASQNVEIHKIN
jgi:hypothetical protein